jgi:plasmid maintenance system antidote protein VapI
VTFHDSHQRLIAQVRHRVQNGELTERALARHLGISQPHVNNVLRGRRKLSPEVADLLLKFFNVSLLDLYADAELSTNLHRRAPSATRGDAATVLKNSIGPGKEWAGVTDGRCRYYCPAAGKGIPGCTVFARLSPDDRMMGVFCGCDIALLDTSISGRLADFPAGIFVVQRDGGTLLRWIRGGFRALYVADEHTLNLPLKWEPLPMCENQRLEYVKARILWLGAEATLRRG